MSVDSRIGFAGLLMTLLGIVVTQLWPDKKWLGWLCLGAAALLVGCWGFLEIKQRFGHTRVAFWMFVLSGGVIGSLFSALIWQSAVSERKKETEAPSSIRLKYSSRQVLQMSNVPGDYSTTLNLDNVATLHLSAPFNREVVTLLWPTSPIVTIAEPRAEEKYAVPGSGDTIRMPQIGHSLKMQGLTLVGQAQRIEFSIAHPIRFIRVGERIFRVSLESIRDKANAERKMFLEYEFSVSEEDQSTGHRAEAITQEGQKPPQPGSASLIEKLLTVLETQPVGTIAMRLQDFINRRPNIVQFSTRTKSFLFDPISRVAVFHVTTPAGRSVDLRLQLEKPAADGLYFIALVWDVSKGARLHVNDKVARDGM